MGVKLNYSKFTRATNPGFGFVRFNRSSTESITHMYMSSIDSEGNDHTGEMSTWDDHIKKTIETIQCKKTGHNSLFDNLDPIEGLLNTDIASIANTTLSSNTSTTSTSSEEDIDVLYKIKAVTLRMGYFELDVSYISGSKTTLLHADELTFNFSRTFPETSTSGDGGGGRSASGGGGGIPAARLGDMCTGHPTFLPRPSVTASSDTFIDGIPALRVGDKYDLHCRIVLPFDCHPGVVIGGSGSVFINNMPAARVGDPIDCGSKIALGSSTAFMG